MRKTIISFAVMALLGFAAMPVEAHISASAFMAHRQIDKAHTGYIAQNLEKILPDITNVEPQDYLGVRYDAGATDAIQPAKDDSEGVAI